MLRSQPKYSCIASAHDSVIQCLPRATEWCKMPCASGSAALKNRRVRLHWWRSSRGSSSSHWNNTARIALTQNALWPGSILEQAFVRTSAESGKGLEANEEAKSLHHDRCNHG